MYLRSDIVVAEPVAVLIIISKIHQLRRFRFQETKRSQLNSRPHACFHRICVRFLCFCNAWAASCSLIYLSSITWSACRCGCRVSYSVCIWTSSRMLSSSRLILIVCANAADESSPTYLSIRQIAKFRNSAAERPVGNIGIRYSVCAVPYCCPNCLTISPHLLRS